MDDLVCLSECVSERRGGLPEFRLGIDAVDEVTHGCGGSFASGDGPLLDSGREVAFGPDAATAPAVEMSVEIDKVRVDGLYGLSGSSCLVVCS